MSVTYYNPWENPGHEALLRKLWVGGLSASEISTALSTTYADANYSRNAVIGKAHRLKLTGKASRTRQPASKPNHAPKRIAAKPALPKPPRKLNTTSNLTALNMAQRSPPVALPRPTHVELEPTATMDTLNSHACKWPIGDPAHPDFGFCGRLKSSEASYCQFHHAIAYRPGNPEKARAYVPKRAA